MFKSLRAWTSNLSCTAPTESSAWRTAKSFRLRQQPGPARQAESGFGQVRGLREAYRFKCFISRPPPRFHGQHCAVAFFRLKPLYISRTADTTTGADETASCTLQQANPQAPKAWQGHCRSKSSALCRCSSPQKQALGIGWRRKGARNRSENKVYSKQDLAQELDGTSFRGSKA